MSSTSQTLTSTPHGLALDESFAVPASEERIQRTAAALREKGYDVHVVDDAAQARTLVNDLLPEDKSVFTSSSETLRLSGIDDDINESGRYRAVRPQLLELREEGRFEEMRVAGSAPDVVVGSMHAVTEDGRLLAASGSGSQLSLYSYAAAKAIWVIGAQKIVPDLDAAMRRIETYSYPLEDQRFRALVDTPAMLSKILIMDGEMFPDRVTVVLVREQIGF